jgi:hypothetical protein
MLLLLPLLWCLLKPVLLAMDDQPNLCGCDDAGPCEYCEPN